MQKLVNQLLDDSRAAIQRDASGRQYFRQRKVRFRTIHFDPEELLQAGWLEFDRSLVSPYREEKDPSSARIKEFARLSSERFLHFYYRVFDVAVARALSTLDTNLFRVPFIVPSIFLDLGIPEEANAGSVPPALHARIKSQYSASRDFAMLDIPVSESPSHDLNNPAKIEIVPESMEESGSSHEVLLEGQNGSLFKSDEAQNRNTHPGEADNTPGKINANVRNEKGRRPGDASSQKEAEAEAEADADADATKMAEPGQAHIYFLSAYLGGLTDDAIELLKPYRQLWELEDRLQEIQSVSRNMRKDFEALLLKNNPEQALQQMTQSLHQALKKNELRAILQATPGADLRASIRLFWDQQEVSALYHLLRHIQDFARFLDEPTMAAAGLFLLPEKLERRIRSALLQESRLHARIMRYNFLRYRSVPTGRTSDLRLLHDQRNQAHRDAVKLLESAKKLNPEVQIWKEILEEHASIRHQIRKVYENYLNPESSSTETDARKAAKTGNTTSQTMGEESGPQPRLDLEGEPVKPDLSRPAPESRILRAATEPLLNKPDSGQKPDPLASADAWLRSENLQKTMQAATSRYGKPVEWPAHIRYGNPFARREVLLHIKEQLLERLRPVRSTTTGYSLIPGSRHGILPLNPVMKLWKEKPGFEANLPEIATREINTPATVECLLSLAALVDQDLYRRQLNLGRILREKLGIQSLGNMKLFLMPGSCGAAREIERPDFPEFRNSVIGESRKPEELGIAGENAILTGGWYKKRNHALYYPIGGDNGQLLRSIYLALRLPGPAAFFFALGQFVHDCLPDNLIYYAGSEVPFRQITEDYYRQEDKVRKNRGEKTGRRRVDNSRPAVRFMFAVAYARALMEALTGSSQSNFRHPPTEKWMSRYLNLPVLSVSERSRFKELRRKSRSLIESHPG